MKKKKINAPKFFPTNFTVCHNHAIHNMYDW